MKKIGVNMKKDKEEKKREIGERLREALKARNVKFGEVAKELGVAPQTLSYWFKGQQDPVFSKIALLFEKYEINPFYVIQGEGPPVLPLEDRKQLIHILQHTRKKKRRKKMKPYKGSIILS